MEYLRSLGPPLVGVFGLLLLCPLLLLALPSLGFFDYTLDDQSLPLLATVSLIAGGFVGTFLTRGEGGVDSVARARSRLVKALYWGSFAVALLAFAVLKHLAFLSGVGRFFPDTPSYVRVAETSLFSQTFWFGERPFTLPLLYKVLGVTTENFQQPTVMAHIQNWQAWIGAGAWVMLAVVVARAIHSRWLRPLGFSVVLSFGLNLHVSQWDRILLSESISTSLFVGTVALALALITARRSRRSRWPRLAGMALLASFLILFSFSRDGNLPLLLIGTLAALGIAAKRLLLSDGAGWPWLVLAMVLGLAIGGQLRGIEFSDRWKTPYYGILQDRILAQSASRSFYVERGMPDGELAREIESLDRHDFLERMRVAEQYRPLWQWVEERGREVYSAYLLRQPLDVLSAPVRQHERLVNPLSTEYRHELAETPKWLGALSDAMFPRKSPLILLWVGLAALGTLHTVWRGSIDGRWWLALLLGTTAYPLMILAWYGDSIEVERHAYLAAFQLRLALWLLSLWIADALVGRLPAHALEPTGHEGSSKG